MKYNPARFRLGLIMITSGIQASGLDPVPYLSRHHRGDWGTLCDEDKAVNEAAIVQNQRILSRYPTVHGDIYVITEWNRSLTTVLFTDEY